MTHVVIDMLKCWADGGEARIPAVLIENSITVPQDSLLEQTRPGLLVPPYLHDTIKWGGLQPFQPGEVVAVQDESHTETVYK
jgi:hypothetical protein